MSFWHEGFWLDGFWADGFWLESDVPTEQPAAVGAGGLVINSKRRYVFSPSSSRSLYEIEEEEEFLEGVIEAADEVVSSSDEDRDQSQRILTELRRLSVLDAVSKVYQGLHADTFQAMTAALKDRLHEVKRQKNLALSLLMIFAADE